MYKGADILKETKKTNNYLTFEDESIVLHGFNELKDGSILKIYIKDNLICMKSSTSIIHDANSAYGMIENRVVKNPNLYDRLKAIYTPSSTFDEIHGFYYTYATTKERIYFEAELTALAEKIKESFIYNYTNTEVKSPDLEICITNSMTESGKCIYITEFEYIVFLSGLLAKYHYKTIEKNDISYVIYDSSVVPDITFILCCLLLFFKDRDTKIYSFYYRLLNHLEVIYHNFESDFIVFHR